MATDGSRRIRRGTLIAATAVAGAILGVILLPSGAAWHAAMATLFRLWGAALWPRHDVAALLWGSGWVLAILALLAVAEAIQAGAMSRPRHDPANTGERAHPAMDSNDDTGAWDYLMGKDARQYRCHKRTGRVERLVGTGPKRRWKAV